MFNGSQGSLSKTGFAAFLACDFIIGFGNRRNNKRILGCACCFRDFLHEDNQVIESTSGQIRPIANLSRICHKLINQHDAGAAFIEQILERFAAGRYALFVGFLHIIVELHVAGFFGKLIRHFAPERVDGAARQIRRTLALGRFKGCTNQHGNTANRQTVHFCFFQHGF